MLCFHAPPQFSPGDPMIGHTVVIGVVKHCAATRNRQPLFEEPGSGSLLHAVLNMDEPVIQRSTQKARQSQL